MKYIKDDLVDMNETTFKARLWVDFEEIRQNYYVNTFNDLDDMGPIESDDFIILGARSNMGKGSLALNIIANACVEHLYYKRDTSNTTGIIFSLKNNRKKVVRDLVSSESEISGHHIKMGNVAKDDIDKIDNAAGRLYNSKIEIFDEPILYTSQIEEKIRICKSESPENEKFIVIIDDLQTLAEERDYVEACRKLKIIARELNVPIILTSQVDPWVEKRSNKRPNLADLDYKGNISNYADKVWLLYRDEVYDPDSYYKKIAELLVRKNKSGPIGTVELFFDASLKKFSGLEKN